MPSPSTAKPPAGNGSCFTGQGIKSSSKPPPVKSHLSNIRHRSQTPSRLVHKRSMHSPAVSHSSIHVPCELSDMALIAMFQATPKAPRYHYDRHQEDSSRPCTSRCDTQITKRPSSLLDDICDANSGRSTRTDNSLALRWIRPSLQSILLRLTLLF